MMILRQNRRPRTIGHLAAAGALALVHAVAVVADAVDLAREGRRTEKLSARLAREEREWHHERARGR